MAQQLFIAGARVIDGTGAPWFRAEILVEEDRICQLLPAGSRPPSGARVLDADGLAAAPGFIDSHSHSDTSYLVDPVAPSKLRQGITTELVGHCGYSAAPLSDETATDTALFLGERGVEVDWRTTRQFMDRLRKARPVLNLALLVGHGTVRRLVMGSDDRPAGPAELEGMRAEVRRAMADGYFGFSTGLIYPPGCYAGPEEIVALAREVAGFGGIYHTHMRDESEGLLESLEETLDAGRQAALRVQVSHHKAVRSASWGKTALTLPRLEEARREGIDVAADQYPYVATSTGLGSLLPAWVHDGGSEAALKRLADPDLRARIRAEMETGRAKPEGWDRIYISWVRGEQRDVEGKHLAQIAAEAGVGPAEAAIHLMEETRLGVGMVCFVLDENDVRRVMAHPLVMIGTDGSALSPDGPGGGGRPHPRSYGTFPRVLGHYARDEGVLTMEEAVRKMTSLPTGRLRLWDRGVIRPGWVADLVLLDPERVADQATFEDPHRFPVGVEYVLVNGTITVDPNGVTGQRPGRVLTFQQQG